MTVDESLKTSPTLLQQVDMTVSAVRQAKFRAAKRLSQLLDDDFTSLWLGMKSE